MESTGYGFPRARRLIKAADFKRVFEKPRKSSDSRWIVLARVNGLDFPRLGLAISKRQVRKAHDRNYLKRVAREGFRMRQHTLGGIDFVVMVRGGAGPPDQASLFRSLQRHWDVLVRQCKPSWLPSSESTNT